MLALGGARQAAEARETLAAPRFAPILPGCAPPAPLNSPYPARG
jgi:hypothetical protein